MTAESSRPTNDQIESEPSAPNIETIDRRLHSRLAKVAEYEADELATRGSLRSLIAAANCVLFRMVFRANRELELAHAEEELSDEPRVQRAKHELLQVAKQIDRYAQLEVKIRQQEQKEQEQRERRPADAVEPVAGASEPAAPKPR